MVAHDTVLSGAALAGTTAGPVILRRTDREFLPAILSGLQTVQGRTALAQTIAAFRDSNHVLTLHQPVHQVFHLAMVQAQCSTPGLPRLDPAKIDSCGLVLRRVSADEPSLTERWSKSSDRIIGWVSCADDDLDPDPALRPPRITSGNFEIDKRLPLAVSPYQSFSESTAPLFVAGPEVCDAAKATILYGLIPVTSAEQSEASQADPAPSYDPGTAAKLLQHLPYFLSPDGSRTIIRANQSLSGADATDPALAAFVSVLKQLKFEFGAFGDAPEGKAILAALNQFDVHDAAKKKLASLGDFLKTACVVLIDQKGGNVAMPDRWPDIDDADYTAIAALIQKALEARLAAILPGEGRFDDVTRQYRLRAFIRVKRPDGCPPELVWSAYSEPFLIAPWYESSGLQPVKIQLPNIDSLKNLKPNVAFAMGEDVFNAMQGDPKKTLKDGPSPGGAPIGLMWLCAFNIPAITICAFIVLNIFLSLFDLIFQWMLFIKICIPIPIPKKSPSAGGG
jgi:hypothetical protein